MLGSSICKVNLRPWELELNPFHQNGEVYVIRKSCYRCLGDTSVSFSGNLSHPKGYASVAEAICTTDTEEDISVVDANQGVFQHEQEKEKKN
ncbi:hypothetical protein MKX01_023110 [Papaver californicum]|nr:hypothetical protein MKX01_023110 [Papaver californicum]